MQKKEFVAILSSKYLHLKSFTAIFVLEAKG